jgi:hypothetical protein
MRDQAPEIGFDRHLELHWLDAVASWAAAGASEAEIKAHFADLLATIDQGEVAKRKNRTVLTAVWLRVSVGLEAFHRAGLALLPAATPAERTAIHFGRCMVAYPFFAFIATQTGRLLGLQGDVSSSDIYRRVAERYGDRSRARRSAQHVLSTLTAWRLLDPLRAGDYVAKTPLAIDNRQLIGWLMEAQLRSTGQEAAPLSALLAHPVFFAFRFPSIAPGEFVRANPRFDSLQQGLNADLVVLAQ